MFTVGSEHFPPWECHVDNRCGYRPESGLHTIFTLRWDCYEHQLSGERVTCPQIAGKVAVGVKRIIRNSLVEVATNV